MKLTEQQARQLAANAVNASIPVGMGHFYFQRKEYTPNDVQQCVTDRGIDIDYFEGRMVKLYIQRNGDEYEVRDTKPRSDYQSWCVKYPTYQDLFNSIL